MTPSQTKLALIAVSAIVGITIGYFIGNKKESKGSTSSDKADKKIDASATDKKTGFDGEEEKSNMSYYAIGQVVGNECSDGNGAWYPINSNFCRNHQPSANIHRGNTNKR